MPRGTPRVSWFSRPDSVRRGSLPSTPVRFNAKRVLFVTHREEILNQALANFRAIRPDATLGFYTGSAKAASADVLFASIQTLGKAEHLRRFSPQSFDYIIIDEFHHASARTYRRLIDYFEPEFFLGLTATPERTDGARSCYSRLMEWRRSLVLLSSLRAEALRESA